MTLPNLLVLLVAFPASFAATSYDFSAYPQPWVVAPANNAWTDAIISTIDPQVANKAPRAESFPSNDWSPYIQHCTVPNRWALTYDDGPSQHTATVLDNLKARGIKATFFVMGTNIIQFPDMLKRIYDEGHEIAIHTWSHPFMSSRTNGEVIAELKYTQMLVEQIVGVKPILFRPPYGDVDDRVAAISHSMGLKIVIWNMDTEDFNLGMYDPKAAYNTATPDQIIQESIKKIATISKATGGISLEHDIMEWPVSIAARIMDEVIKAGFQPVSVGECLGGIEVYEGRGAPSTTTRSMTTSSSTTTTSTTTTSTTTPSTTTTSTTTTSTTTTSTTATIGTTTSTTTTATSTTSTTTSSHPPSSSTSTNTQPSPSSIVPPKDDDHMSPASAQAQAWGVGLVVLAATWIYMMIF